jgi:hypothetical protein
VQLFADLTRLADSALRELPTACEVRKKLHLHAPTLSYLHPPCRTRTHLNIRSALNVAHLGTPTFAYMVRHATTEHRRCARLAYMVRRSGCYTYIVRPSAMTDVRYSGCRRARHSVTPTLRGSASRPYLSGRVRACPTWCAGFVSEGSLINSLATRRVIVDRRVNNSVRHGVPARVVSA